MLAINVTMFVVEIGAGYAIGSASLQADALDFLGDAGSYLISLVVLSMALRYRAMAALGKGLTMGAFGLWVTGTVIWHAAMGTVPEPITMGVIGVGALVANAVCAALLYAYPRWTPTCGRFGFAHLTTCSAIWRYCWQLLACSARAPAGPI